MDTTNLEGKISRININHESRYATFMLEGDKTMYRLQYGKYLDREEAQAIDLTQQGDHIAVTYYPDANDDVDGDMTLWENRTLGASASSPGDSL